MKMMTPTNALCAAALSLGLIATADAAIVHVPAQFPTIQAAINAPSTMDNDEIVVAPGVYTGQVNFGLKNLIVRSSGGPQVTTINALGMGTAVTIDQNQTDDTVLDGFTITGGTGTLFGVRTAGGGLVVFTSNPVIANCLFVGNSAMDGGGAYCFVANPKFANCAFLENTANGFQGRGGGVFCEQSSPLFVNVTITNNTSLNGGFGGGIYTLSGAPRLINTINHTNAPGSLEGSVLSMPIASFSNVDGGFPGEGNIDANPMFTDVASGDITLLDGSPCIDRGDSLAIGADYFTDLGGSPRGVDCPDELDRGVAFLGLTVDLGAYEWQLEGTCQPDTCPLDVDNSNVIDFGDILEIIINWGPCPQG